MTDLTKILQQLATDIRLATIEACAVRAEGFDNEGNANETRLAIAESIRAMAKAEPLFDTHGDKVEF